MMEGKILIAIIIIIILLLLLLVFVFVFVINVRFNFLLGILVHGMQPTILLSGQAAPSVSDPPAEVRSSWAAKQHCQVGLLAGILPLLHVDINHFLPQQQDSWTYCGGRTWGVGAYYGLANWRRSCSSICR